MFDGFKKFILRGNVIDLAVAVIVGAAFTQIVTAVVTNLLTPLVAAIFGKPDYDHLQWTLNGSSFKYGAVINAALNFAFIAATVYFLIVTPLNHLADRRKAKAGVTEPELEETERELLAQIRDALRERAQ